MDKRPIPLFSQIINHDEDYAHIHIHIFLFQNASLFSFHTTKRVVSQSLRYPYSLFCPLCVSPKGRIHCEPEHFGICVNKVMECNQNVKIRKPLSFNMFLVYIRSVD